MVSLHLYQTCPACTQWSLLRQLYSGVCPGQDKAGVMITSWLVKEQQKQDMKTITNHHLHGLFSIDQLLSLISELSVWSTNKYMLFF